MNNWRIVAKKRNLDSLFAYVEDLRELDDPLLEGHWAKYLCVLVSGFLETSVKSIFTSYTTNTSHRNVANYVSFHFEKGRLRSMNMNPSNIIGLAGAFSEVWRDRVRQFMAYEGRREAIQSVVKQRNLIAHGGTSTISYSDVRDYYRLVVEVIEFLEELCEQGA